MGVRFRLEKRTLHINPQGMQDNLLHTYQKIQTVLEYIDTHYTEQPNLDELAAFVNLSPFHFQRLFSDWVGTSPKKFLQYTTLTHAKRLLKQQQLTLFDATNQLGLSAPSRLHDLFVQIEGMTPAEYKQGGEGLTITYQFAMSPFGEVLVANTEKGICTLVFIEAQQTALDELRQQFPNAHFIAQATPMQMDALAVFQPMQQELKPLRLHLKGSQFQINVWQALLTIPLGTVTSYGTVAAKIEHPKAARAVGTAIGQNPVAYLIPCHRVIQSSGLLGGYMWGMTRKKVILAWETIQLEHMNILP